MDESHKVINEQKKWHKQYKNHKFTHLSIKKCYTKLYYLGMLDGQ